MKSLPGSNFRLLRSCIRKSGSRISPPRPRQRAPYLICDLALLALLRHRRFQPGRYLDRGIRRAGWLLPLDRYVAASALPLEDFLPAGLACSTYRGHLYSLPWFADASVLYYRQDLYAAAGLPPPRTFADLLAVRGLRKGSAYPMGSFFRGRPMKAWSACSWSSSGATANACSMTRASGPGQPPKPGSHGNSGQSHVRDGVSPLAVATFMEEDCRHAFEQGYAVLCAIGLMPTP